MSKERIGKDMPNTNWAQEMTEKYPAFIGDKNMNKILLEMKQARMREKDLGQNPPQDNLTMSLERKDLATQYSAVNDALKAYEMKLKVHQTKKRFPQSNS